MEKQPTNENRRDFLKTLIPAGTMLCMGCSTALSMKTKKNLYQEQDFDSKIKKEFSISWEQFLKDRFRTTIALMKTFAEHYDKDELIKLCKDQADKSNLETKPYLEAKSVKDFILPMENHESVKNCVEYEYIEFTDKVCQLKFTNCLYAKTFRDKDAGDFGYAIVCHADFSGATAFNPKLKLERTKTLMQGHDCCDHRYIWEG